MRILPKLLLALTLAALPAAAPRADTAGAFDYYVLALSWSPNWCARTGDARGADQCDARHDHGWVLHGLWPQYERGWPEDCATDRRPPSRAENDAMADIQGSGGLAAYQWRKHGRCSGLSGRDYHRAARQAYDSVVRPDLLRRLTDPVRLPASVIEDAFLEANPGWTADMLTITCRDGDIAEARLCLTRGLEPRVCAPDARRDCTLDRARFAPIR
ncbi:ribonuclease T [Meridianimarinicoccus roseus]|uniref:Ribonuclease T n=1 Tax=Meridianimarinicoccus roseus TaxID=2072018 RepID=A0A2V2L839_9RHOB|nr:ribonuclease T2 [Meridianimarinicoccus roseus]PWR01588.1 ribonuclease T [Meridianimarinicoccus roseus]